MMVITALRGADSTGIALVTEKNKRPKVAKTVGDPYYLIHSDIWPKLDETISKDTLAAFGHGRWATKGKVNTKNAHPFIHEHLTMVHNGTITYGVDYKHENQELEVDSHALTIGIAKEGWKKLEDVGGAYAIIAHDSKEGCMYVIRNTERPLYLATFPNRTIIMSEYGAIKYLADRVPALYTKDGPTVKYFEQDKLYRFELETGAYEVVEEIRKKYNTQYRTSSAVGWVHGGGTAGNKHAGKIVYAVLDTIKELPSGNGPKMYEYTFLDNKDEYLCVTTKYEPDRIGLLCQARIHRIVNDLVTKKTECYFKYRDVVYYDNDSKPINDEVPEEIVTKNGKRLTKTEWGDLCATENCELCQGPIYKGEYDSTIILTGGSVICAECVKAGRANSMGVIS